MISEAVPWDFVVCACQENHAFILLCVPLCDCVFGLSTQMLRVCVWAIRCICMSSCSCLQQWTVALRMWTGIHLSLKPRVASGCICAEQGCLLCALCVPVTGVSVGVCGSPAPLAGVSGCCWVWIGGCRAIHLCPPMPALSRDGSQSEEDPSEFTGNKCQPLSPCSASINSPTEGAQKQRGSAPAQ